jgi:hypothetical protein
MEALREVAVPRSTFSHLRRELGREVGPLPAIHALHTAGFTVGTAAAAAFADGLSDVDSLPEDEFWTRMTAFFLRRGWGTLTHRAAGEALGLLTSADWAEASEDEQSDEASCSFSTGFLGGLLTEMAGGPIAVLEVSCRGRGDDACRFAFGSESAIHKLYGRLLDGADLERALTDF